MREPSTNGLKLEIVFLRVIIGYFCLQMCLSSYYLSQFLRSDLLHKDRSNESNFSEPTSQLSGSRSFGIRFENYLSDHLLLKRTLIRLRNDFLYYILKTSGSAKAFVGKDGWLFLTVEHTLKELIGTEPYTVQQLEYLQTIFEQRATWCQKRHCHYVLMVAPNKETVYPEKTGLNYNVAGTRYHQFYEWMKAKSFVPIVDIYAALKQTSGSRLTYSRYDTHWNGYGAASGYRKLMSTLQSWYPLLSPLPESETAVVDDFSRGDLAIMLKIDVSRSARKTVAVVPLNVYWKSDFDPQKPRYVPFKTWIDDSSLPRAVVLRDSFFDAPKLLFSQHFSEVDYFLTYDFPEHLIEQSKPNIVVQEFTERVLCDGDVFNTKQLRKEIQCSEKNDVQQNQLPHVENIVFGDSVRLLKAYAWPCPDGLVVSSLWTSADHPELSKFLGGHAIDENGKILSQFDHEFVPQPRRRNSEWRDVFIVPFDKLRGATGIALSVYYDPQQTLLIKGGSCDWGNHRLVVRLQPLRPLQPLQSFQSRRN